VRQESSDIQVMRRETPTDGSKHFDPTICQAFLEMAVLGVLGDLGGEDF
jgi:hypothetical protein